MESFREMTQIANLPWERLTHRLSDTGINILILLVIVSKKRHTLLKLIFGIIQRNKANIEFALGTIDS